MIDRTESAVRKMLDAIPAPSYDVGIQNGSDAPQTEASISREDVIARLPVLKARNSRGAHIYIRPASCTLYTLLDDVSYLAVQQMHKDGYGPCAVLETSPHNFQAWLRHSAELPKELATAAAKLLSQRYGADPSAAGWLRFGRLAGFTNRKPKHMRPDGRFPFVLLRETSKLVFGQADSFRSEVSGLHTAQESERQTMTSARDSSLSPQRGRRSSHLEVVRFRALPKFADRPAAADLAYAKASLAAGATEAEVAAMLTHAYLSSDPSKSRREQYVSRTVRKALAG